MGKPMKAIPAFREPAARLEVMDELGLDYRLMFPTLASLVEEREGRSRVILDIVHALNEWMYETWQFDYEDRIFSTPVINLGDRRPRTRGTRVVPRARRQDRPCPACAGAGNARHPFVRRWRSSTVLGRLRQGRHPGVDARLGQRLLRVPQRLGARRRVQAVRADIVPDGRDGQAAHRGHHGRAGLPRCADPQPGSAHPVGRERRGLGALSVQAVQERLLEDAAWVPRGSNRGIPPLRLRRTVLGGRFRPDGRPVRRRPRDLRLRLAPPRGLWRSRRT